MNKKMIIVLPIVVVLLIVLIGGRPFYVLNEDEQAVVTKFGKIAKIETESGLKVKTPFVDNVTIYSKQILSWDGDAQRIPTKENQFIYVDPTSRWRIVDPALFYETVNSVSTAQLRLDDILDSTIRTVISENYLNEAVRSTNRIKNVEIVEEVSNVENAEDAEKLKVLTESTVEQDTIRIGREGLSNQMLKSASEYTRQYGIELVDIVIRQIRYSDDLTESVYQRMIKERNQIAEAYRSYGRGQQAQWEGKTKSEQQTILSEAYAKAEEVKGIADAQATKIYADAYSSDPEFFELWRTLDSFKKTVPQMNKILTTDLSYFDLMY